jgi:hypothetical protein
VAQAGLVDEFIAIRRQTGGDYSGTINIAGRFIFDLTKPESVIETFALALIRDDREVVDELLSEGYDDNRSHPKLFDAFELFANADEKKVCIIGYKYYDNDNIAWEIFDFDPYHSLAITFDRYGRVKEMNSGEADYCRLVLNGKAGNSSRIDLLWSKQGLTGWNPQTATAPKPPAPAPAKNDMSGGITFQGPEKSPGQMIQEMSDLIYGTRTNTSPTNQPATVQDFKRFSMEVPGGWIVEDKPDGKEFGDKYFISPDNKYALTILVRTVKELKEYRGFTSFKSMATFFQAAGLGEPLEATDTYVANKPYKDNVSILQQKAYLKKNETCLMVSFITPDGKISEEQEAAVSSIVIK